MAIETTLKQLLAPLSNTYYPALQLRYRIDQSTQQQYFYFNSSTTGAPMKKQSHTLHLKMLNANSFFTLDDDANHDFSSTHSQIRQNISHRREHPTLYEEKGVKYKINGDYSGVRSAQQARSILANSPKKFRFSINMYNPYNRIKKVDDTIMEYKKLGEMQKIDNTMIEVMPLKNSEFNPKLTFRNTYMQSERRRSKHLKALSSPLASQKQECVVNSLAETQELIPQIHNNTFYSNKNFTQNYKNRRKLTQRVVNRKNIKTNNKIRSISPLNWRQKHEENKDKEIRYHQIVPEQQNFMESIEGNKIKYLKAKKDELKVFRRYNKSKKLKEILTNINDKDNTPLEKQVT